MEGVLDVMPLLYALAYIGSLTVLACAFYLLVGLASWLDSLISMCRMDRQERGHDD